MPGYRIGPELTEEVMGDGWRRTGDEGHVEDEGYLYLVDRVEDMIVSGGETVPDDVLGEQVHAIVVREPGSDVGEDVRPTPAPASPATRFPSRSISATSRCRCQAPSSG
jgi:acyl-CoA synthetase (AMP-forming)/AMP-acid ligase II